MGFGNSQFLWALPLVALPVLLHLFFRRRKSQVEFSTIRFFRVRERFLAHRRRLREWLLLLLRCLALLMLILGLSRPLHRGVPFLGDGRTDAVIVLDDSMSMGRPTPARETAFDLAKRKASEALSTLGEGDGCALVFTSGRQGIQLTRRRQEVERAIEDAFVTGAAGSFAAALDNADSQLARSAAPNRELFLLSDFQEAQVPSAPIAFSQGGAVRVYFMKVGGDVANLAIGEIATSAKPKVAGQPLSLTYSLINAGAVERGVEVALKIAGREVQTDFIVAPARGTARSSISYVPVGPGMLTGSLVVSDDSLRLDNEAFFAVAVVDELKIALLQGDVLSRFDAFQFFESAVCPPERPGLNGILAQRGYLQDVRAAQLAGVHVAVLADPASLAAEAAALLARHVERGGGLICFAGGRTQPDSLAALSAHGVDIAFRERRSMEALGLDFSGPLSPLNELLQMDLLVWRRLTPLALDAEWEVWGEVGGEPVIAARPFGRGRLVVTAFSARRDYSNWPELKSFPIVMIHLLNAVAHDIDSPPAISCGRVVRVAADTPDGGLVASIDGSRLPLAVDAAGEALVEATWRPGILRVEGGMPRVVAINPDLSQSQLRTVSGERAARAMLGTAVSQLDTADVLAGQIGQFRQGKDLAGVCLLLAGLAMLAESLLANRYRGAVRRTEVDA